MQRIIYVLSLFVALLAGCGTPMPNVYSLGNIYSSESIQPDKATIYIFHRTSQVQAPCFITENAVKIGVIKSGTYFTRHVFPGEYEYMSTNDSHVKSPIRIKVECGKEYFIEATQQSDFFMAHPYLNVVGKEQAESILPTLKRITYTPKSQ